MEKLKTTFDKQYLSKTAIKGATTGIVIGSRFGFYGMAVGAVIGGLTGFAIEEIKIKCS